MKKRKNLPIGDGQTEKKNPLPKVLALVAATGFFLLIYEISIKYQFYPVLMWIYMGLWGAATIAFCILNKGFSNATTDKDALPADWSAADKQLYLDRERQRKKYAKYLIYIILPIIIVVFIDLVDLYAGDVLERLGLKSLIQALFGGGNS